MDSRRKGRGGLFFCISGARFDAHDYAAQAVQNGAAALVVERFLPWTCPRLLVTDTRLAFGPMCAELYGHPARQMKMVGITGTKGKTTTSYLMKAILEKAGLQTRSDRHHRQYDWRAAFAHGSMTTPEADRAAGPSAPHGRSAACRRW